MTVDYMTARPLSTVLSTTSCDSSARSAHSASTALTSPSLFSPGLGKTPGAFQPPAEIHEGADIGEQLDGVARVPLVAAMEPPHTGSAVGPASAVSRGSRVRDRASKYEQAVASTSAAGRTRSTSPLRFNRAASNTHTPTMTTTTTTHSAVRRVPVPATAPPRARYGDLENRPGPSSVASPPRPREPSRAASGLKRGSGSARRMIEQWESGVAALTSASTSASADASRVPRRPSVRAPSRQHDSSSGLGLPKDYLDQKPLPIPRATPTAASSYYSPGPTMPGRSYLGPAQHLQTPTPLRTQQSRGSLTPSPSSYSMTSAGSDKKRRGSKSPLKDFFGGIKEMGRKAKGRGRDSRGNAGMPGKTFVSLDGKNDPWIQPVGTAGLPGGIVLTDRMGDDEMWSGATGDPNAIRTSAIMYLVATPCSSVSLWGSWLTSYATLTPALLRVTYCPVFQPGHATPRRVMSGLAATCMPATPYAAIPPPDRAAVPDVELSMTDCVEVRSLRRDEVKGRGIPAVPEGVGTEVLELVFGDGSKRYIGVEGVNGRLGWVSAIWDVLLACKQNQLGPMTLPPQTPVGSIGPCRSKNYGPPDPAEFHPQLPPPGDIAPLDTPYPCAAGGDPASPVPYIDDRRSAPPVQKVGGKWVAASALGSSDVDAPQRRPSPDVLRDSVARMFEAGPDFLPQGDDDVFGSPHRLGIVDAACPALGRSDSAATAASATDERVRAWQTVAVNPYVPDKTDTLLSFDPNDLNPSRSASQARRAPPAHAPAPGRTLAAVTEGSEDGSGASHGGSVVRPNRAPSHISHVTFPKPSVGGQRFAAPAPAPALASIPAGSETSCETASAESARTPRSPRSHETAPSSVGSARSGDPAVLVRLDTHSAEHGGLAKQIDHVHAGLERVALSVADLVQRPDVPPDVARANEIAQAVAGVDSRVAALGLDVRAIESAIQLSALASSRQPAAAAAPAEPLLPDVHAKLDSIVKLCQEVLAASRAGASQAAVATPAMAPVVATATSRPPSSAKSGSGAADTNLALPASNADADVQQAGDEVAHIMADITGGSVKSPRRANLQVLHSAPPSPQIPASPHMSAAPAAPTAASEATGQVAEILGLVRELQGARTMQTQQATDIARYLNELNAWLEQFVRNSGQEINTMSRRLTALVGDDAGASEAGHDGALQAQGAGLIAELHAMVADQKRRMEQEGPMGQRLDALLAMMAEDKERQSAQQNLVEQVIAIVERQRLDNQMLLQALAKDLTQEIRGERVRFIDAMQQATSVNVQFHVEEFKKLLSAEVNKSMRELGRVREEKKALQQEISDLFALKAKHGASSGDNSRRGSLAPPRGLPATPQ
ncbi:hypothetical protein Q5752_003016 [Cryptotrichosporon argae]